MKIKLTDGVTELDTDKMGDLEAQLLEKAKDLYDFCQAQKISILCSMNYNGDVCSGFTNFVDFQGFGKIAFHIDSTLKANSNNTLGICRLENTDSAEEKKENQPDGTI